MAADGLTLDSSLIKGCDLLAGGFGTKAAKVRVKDGLLNWGAIDLSEHFNASACAYNLQCHSNKVVLIKGLDDITPRSADALVSNVKGVLLVVLTADCAPILAFDSGAGVIGAAHAGWRGAHSNVMSNMVNGMEKLGAQRHRIELVIGPHIAKVSYEVSDEFRQEFLQQDKKNEVFFTRPKGTEKTKYVKGLEGSSGLFFDLGAYLMTQAGALGVAAVEHLARDTYQEDQVFFSHRRETKAKEAKAKETKAKEAKVMETKAAAGQSGGAWRQASAIMLR